MGMKLIKGDLAGNNGHSIHNVHINLKGAFKG